MGPVGAHSQGEVVEMRHMTGQDGEVGAAGTQGGSEARWMGDTGRKDHVGAGREGKRLAAAGGGGLALYVSCCCSLCRLPAPSSAEGKRS